MCYGCYPPSYHAGFASPSNAHQTTPTQPSRSKPSTSFIQETPKSATRQAPPPSPTCGPTPKQASPAPLNATQCTTALLPVDQSQPASNKRDATSSALVTDENTITERLEPDQFEATSDTAFNNSAHEFCDKYKICNDKDFLPKFSENKSPTVNAERVRLGTIVESNYL